MLVLFFVLFCEFVVFDFVVVDVLVLDIFFLFVSVGVGFSFNLNRMLFFVFVMLVRWLIFIFWCFEILVRILLIGVKLMVFCNFFLMLLFRLLLSSCEMLKLGFLLISGIRNGKFWINVFVSVCMFCGFIVFVWLWVIFCCIKLLMWIFCLIFFCCCGFCVLMLLVFIVSNRNVIVIINWCFIDIIF